MTATTDGRREGPITDEPSVLVVDDDAAVADLYGEFLEDDHDVTVVYGGGAALEAVGPGFDVVLLDRRMPGTTGDDVLAEIRRRNLDCRVAMVTAVDPDFDIIEMPFDEYLVKPVSREELRATVERLVLGQTFGDVEYELSSLRVKRNVLAAEMTAAQLADSEEFARLRDRIAELEARLAELESRLEEDADGAHGAA